MLRSTVDLPEDLNNTTFNWDIDWRGQPPSGNTSGTSQVVFNQFPRWVGSPSFFIEPENLGTWRGIRAKVNGRKNVLRVRMDDKVSFYDHVAFTAELGSDVPKPQDLTVTTYAESPVGTSTLYLTVLDGYPTPSVGQIISYNDYPYVVTDSTVTSVPLEWTTGGTDLVWKSGDVDMVWQELDGDTNFEVEVEMPLRTAVPISSDVDWVGRGLFEFQSDTTGNPEYSGVGFSNASFELKEYLR